MSASTLDRWVRRGVFGLVCIAWSFSQIGCGTSAYNQGRQALRGGDPETAMIYFDQSIEAQLKVFESTREKAAAMLASGKAEAAITELQQLRSSRPDDSRTLWLLGQAYSDTDQFSEAAEAYREYGALTASERTKEKTQLRVAQLERAISDQLAVTILDGSRAGRKPDENTVAVVAFLPPLGSTAAAAETDDQDARIRRALVAFASADLAKVSQVEVIADDMMASIRDELAFTYDNRQYFEQGSLVPQGTAEPAQHLVYGYFEGLDPAAVSMGAVHHESEAGTKPCSAHDGHLENLMELETDVVIDVLAAMRITPTDAERLAIGDKPTRNLEAFIAFGEGLRQRDAGNYGDAAKAFTMAASLDPGFSLAADQAVSAEAASLGSAAVDVPPPPAPIQTAAARAAASSSVLGFGMAPGSERGPNNGGDTTDLVTVRGTATIGVRGQTDPTRGDQ